MGQFGRRAALLLTALLPVCGCKPAKTPARETNPAASGAVDTAERALRAILPAAAGAAARFRGMQFYAQAMPDRVAVCGQVSPYPDDAGLFVMFVAVVRLDAHGRATDADSVFAGTDVAAAGRTYMALVSHCYPGGGPADGPMPGVAPIPPLPNTVPQPAPARSAPVAPSTAPPTGAGPVPVPAPQDGSVVMRRNGTLHDGPHGAALRVVPQGTALHVFAGAPGGWLQVGDTAPWGWVHDSMVDRR